MPAIPGQLGRLPHVARPRLRLVDRVLARIQLARSRREADRCLLNAEAGAAISSAFAWRIAELTNGDERHTLGRSLRDLVSDLSPDRLPGSTPLNRVGVRPYTDRLLGLAARLEQFDVAVTPKGMLLVRELLSDGASPLYLYGDAEALPAQLEQIRDALDGR